MRDTGQTYNNVDTLDHHVIAQTNAVKNNIRKALRTKYTIDEAVTIKHFGFIDQPPPAEDCGPVSLPALSSLLQQVRSSALMRGVVWTHREKVFSRWKERFIVVTKDYLQCYKKVATEASQMGPFLHQIRLSDVSNVSLVDRKGYLTLLLQLNKEDNLVLRRAENIRDWYNVILSLVVETRARHMPSAEQFWGRKEGTEVSSDWRDLYERPSSVASVDRRHRHRHRHKRRGKSHSKTDTSQVSSPALRSLSVDRDSGNYSLQTASDKQSA